MNKKTVTEAIGEIDNRFIAEAMDYKCERRQIVMSKKTVTIIIAAAFAMLLSVSVAAAVTFTGLVDKNSALDSAMEYVVHNAETAEVKDILNSYIYAGVAEIEMFEEQQVDLGLKDFRAVYNISFRLGEYAYKIGVDAKTGVVLSYESDVDEDWRMERQGEETNVHLTKDYGDYFSELEKFQNVIAPNDLQFIAEEYTGLYAAPQAGFDTDICKNDRYLGASWRGVDVEYMRDIHGYEIEDFPEDYDKYRTYCYEITHGGYKYTLYIDSVTGEVQGCDITECGEYEGERHLHEASDEYIGPYQAWNLFRAETGIDYDSIMGWWTYRSSFIPEGGVILLEGGTSENTYGKDIYYVSVTMKQEAGGETAVCVIDAKTGEIIETYYYTGDPNAKHNQVASTEAPEGMISEAFAKAIALEDLGITDRELKSFTIELKENEARYEISITDANDISYTYKVDAVSGQISDRGER